MARTELPDAPYIQNLRNTGYRDGKDPSYPVCPVCGQECEIVYRTETGRLSGAMPASPIRMLGKYQNASNVKEGVCLWKKWNSSCR